MHLVVLAGVNHIDISAAKQRQQLRGSVSLSNRTYKNRLMLTYSTGKRVDGWAFSVSGSKRWSEEGFIDATLYNAYAYFLGVEKELNPEHSLGLNIFGAPSKRGGRGASTQEMYDIADNNWYNPYWGFQEGEKRNSRIRESHLPTAILSHKWKLTDHSNLSTSVSYQTGKSGQTRLDWNDLNDPRPDYYRRLPSYQADSAAAAFIWNELSNNEELRQVDWARLYRSNFNSNQTIENADGIHGNSITGKRSQVVLQEQRYDPTRIGVGINFQDFLNETTTLTGGIQYRSEKQETYQLIDDLLGGEFFVDIDKFATTDFGVDSEETQNDLNRPNRIVRVGDRYGYDYDGKINEGKLWGQGEFVLQKVDLFVAGNISNTSFWRTGNVRNGKFPDTSFGDSEKQDFFNYGIKGGATYKIDGRNYVYTNGGYLTRAPFFRNSFVSPRTRNQVVDDLQDEKISSVEGGYLMRSPNLKARATAYFTKFQDRTETTSAYFDLRNSFVNYVLTGVDEEHKGVELAVEGKVNSELTVIGVAALGENKYVSRPNIKIFQDNAAELLDETEIFQNNFYVPGTPQTALTGSLNYRGKQYWFANLSFNYFDDTYLDFDPMRRTRLAVQGLEQGSEQYNEIIFQKKAPSAFTMDFFGGKSFKFNDNFLYINIGVSNILDNQEHVTGGYEQRLRFNTTLDNPDRFGPNLYYAFGRNYFINLSFRH